MTPLAKLLEAALFASARPIPTEELAALDQDASKAALASALDELREHYDVDGHGVELVEIGGGWQILTRAEYTAKSLRGRDKYSCEKPLDLMLALVSDYSDPGETVFDPCAGTPCTNCGPDTASRVCLP